MVKTFKSLLLQNQKSYDLETLHELDLFYGKVKFGNNLGFSMEKSENSGFFQKLLQPVTLKLVGADI